LLWSDRVAHVIGIDIRSFLRSADPFSEFRRG
jgi:hypothetical protein